MTVLDRLATAVASLEPHDAGRRRLVELIHDLEVAVGDHRLDAARHDEALAALQRRYARAVRLVVETDRLDEELASRLDLHLEGIAAPGAEEAPVDTSTAGRALTRDARRAWRRRSRVAACETRTG